MSDLLKTAINYLARLRDGEIRNPTPLTRAEVGWLHDYLKRMDRVTPLEGDHAASYLLGLALHCTQNRDTIVTVAQGDAILRHVRGLMNQTPAAAGLAWEYQVLTVTGHEIDQRFHGVLTELLNFMGQQGWEAFQVQETAGDAYLIYWKRQVQTLHST